MKLHFILVALVSLTSFCVAADKKATKALTSADLGKTQVHDSNAAIMLHSWSLGGTVGYSRKFKLSANFYTVKDRLVIKYPVSSSSYTTTDFGVLGGNPQLGPESSYTFEIPANVGAKPVTITITADDDKSSWLRGQTTRRIGWDYVMTEVNPRTGELINLQPVVVDDGRPWRPTLGGVVGGTTVASLIGQSGIRSRLFQFDVPPGTRCLRLVYESNLASLISLRPDVPPEPGKKASDGYLSQTANVGVRKTIVVSKPAATRWFAYVSSSQDIDLVTSGFTIPFLVVDCMQGGIWTQASANEGNSQVATVAVGIESADVDAANVFPGAGSSLTLLSHGRVNSPKDMLPLGNALARRWNRTSYYVNWSEGAHWNTFHITYGSRFIGPAADAITKVAKLAGRKTDFFGHSWGTYMGNALSVSSNTTFSRFFALDPAAEGKYYKGAATIKFSSRAVYSMGIYGDGLFGSAPLTRTADDAIWITRTFGNADTSTNQHWEPVEFMRHMVEQTANAIGSELFQFRLDSDGSITSGTPWFKGLGERADIKGIGEFNARVYTNGFGEEPGHGIPVAVRYRTKANASRAVEVNEQGTEDL